MKKFYKFGLVLFFSTFFILFNMSTGVCKKKLKLAVLDIEATGVEQSLADTLSEVLVAETRKIGKYDVIGKSEIKAMLGFEQEKQMLSCSDDTSCLAEIGGALGVDMLLIGSIGRLGKTFVLNLKAVNIKNATVEGHVYETVKGEEEVLLKTIKISVGKLFGKPVVDKSKKSAKQDTSKQKLDKSLKKKTKNTTDSSGLAFLHKNWSQNITGWALLGAGVLSAGSGTFFGLQVKEPLDSNGDGFYDNMSQTEAEEMTNTAMMANVLFAVSGASIIGSAVCFITGIGGPKTAENIDLESDNLNFKFSAVPLPGNGAVGLVSFNY